MDSYIPRHGIQKKLAQEFNKPFPYMVCPTIFCRLTVPRLLSIMHRGWEIGYVKLNKERGSGLRDTDRSLAGGKRPINSIEN